MATDILSAVRQLAEEYRLRSHMLTGPIEVDIPYGYVVKLIAAHGSLRAAADATFRPDTVTLTCREWREVQYTANRQVQLMFPHFFVTPVDELFRIAVSYG